MSIANPPRIINNFQAHVGHKGYLEYIIVERKIIVCEFSPIDTIARYRGTQPARNLSRALIAGHAAYAKLDTTRGWDKLLIKCPIHLLTYRSPDPTIRADLLWFVRYIEKSFPVEIHAEFIKLRDDQIMNKSVQCRSAEFFRLAVDSFY
jgi:hypothetical protein